MNTGNGEGDLVHQKVTENGSVRLRMLGKDEKSGRWASFWVHLPWAEWCRLNESLYNDREEVAQARIPD